jgi:E3 ubiquitin-protein ligase NEDD4
VGSLSKEAEEFTDYFYSRATEDSIVQVQILDNRKFKKKDQGFLGEMHFRVGDQIELQSEIG